MKAPKILYIAHECPWPADIGLKNHLLHMIRQFQRIGELHVFGYYLRPGDRARWESFAVSEGFTLVGLEPMLDGARLRRRQAACLLRGRPLVEARYDTAPAGRAVAGALAAAGQSGQPFDWVAYELFPTMLRLPEGSPRQLLFPVDSYSLYYSRMREQASGLGEWVRASYLAWACGRAERKRYGAADVMATVAPADAQALARQVPGARIEVVPVPAEGRLARLPFRGRARRPRVLVCGYYGMPTIARDTGLFLDAWRKPGAAFEHELVVWGRGAAAAGLARRVHALGGQILEWAPDYDATLAAGDIYVYPQRFACGVQTKVQQAMTAGLAVVAGPAVLGALGARGGEEAYAADDPAAAAAALAELLAQGPGEIDRIGAAGARLMREKFSENSIEDRLRRILEAPARACHQSAAELAEVPA